MIRNGKNFSSPQISARSVVPEPTRSNFVRFAARLGMCSGHFGNMENVTTGTSVF